MTRALLTLIVLNCLAGCGASLPAEKRVGKDFANDYPTAELVGVSIGEGPRESAYVHFHFRAENSKEVNKVVWTYGKLESDDWEITDKAQPLLPLD